MRAEAGAAEGEVVAGGGGDGAVGDVGSAVRDPREPTSFVRVCLDRSLAVCCFKGEVAGSHEGTASVRMRNREVGLHPPFHEEPGRCCEITPGNPKYFAVVVRLSLCTHTHTHRPREKTLKCVSGRDTQTTTTTMAIASQTSATSKRFCAKRWNEADGRAPTTLPPNPPGIHIRNLNCAHPRLGDAGTGTQSIAA